VAHFIAWARRQLILSRVEAGLSKMSGFGINMRITGRYFDLGE
jgi:hypothetical protein